MIADGLRLEMFTRVPVALGRVHQRVRIDEQLIEALGRAPPRDGADSDGRGLAAVRLGEAALDASNHRRRLVAVGVGKQQHELVAADPRKQVGRPQDGLRRLSQMKYGRAESHLTPHEDFHAQLVEALVVEAAFGERVEVVGVCLQRVRRVSVAEGRLAEHGLAAAAARPTGSLT